MNKDEVKALINDAGLHCWEVAYKWSMTDGNFSRKLRKPFSDSDVKKLKEIIKELKAEKE